jgi:hypothetical protein
MSTSRFLLPQVEQVCETNPDCLTAGKKKGASGLSGGGLLKTADASVVVGGDRLPHYGLNA